MSEEFVEKHSSPLWRLDNLYFVKDALTGRAVKFVPRPQQSELIEAIYLRGERNILVPKARQLGISTIIDLIILDSMLFHGGIQAAIIDLTFPDGGVQGTMAARIDQGATTPSMTVAMQVEPRTA